MGSQKMKMCKGVMQGMIVILLLFKINYKKIIKDFVIKQNYKPKRGSQKIKMCEGVMQDMLVILLLFKIKYKKSLQIL